MRSQATVGPGDILADSALSADDRQSVLPENLPLRSARVYIALPYIKLRIFMHSVPVAVLTAEERRKANWRPKGKGAAPFLAIDIHYSRSAEAESASRPLGDTSTLCPYQCWEQGFSPQLTTTVAAVSGFPGFFRRCV